ncbi:MAG: glycerol-3-phosphate acyltransferase [Coriobacteriia bacterium]
MREVLSVGIGYLLGSVLPAYLFGRARGIDLRKEGLCNAGTTNAYYMLGLRPAVVTATYDLSKGLLAMLIASQLGVGRPWMYAAGAAAVAGHRLPVWLRFRGANGMAASVGLLLYCLTIAIAQGWLSWLGLLVLAGLVGLTFMAFHSGAATGVIMMPALAAAIAVRSTDPAFVVFLLAILSYIWVVNLGIAVKEHSFRLGKKRRAIS